ncbi:MAG TPA: iron-sulfur cluster assembly accessory protein [Polyangiaceae bacterium]|jgi:iron-sulfur cluster assembly protein|nr:iron-sulfur cluster assembly accessory protein [Polyangiaceae bacterium]
MSQSASIETRSTQSGPAPASKTVGVSDAAVLYAKQRLAQRGTPDAAIRLGVRGGGCSGFSYVIEFSDDPPRERDLTFEFDGVKFYVDKKSIIYLAGSVLDYEKTVMFNGFKFKNPQEASKCGCGHSFTVR